LATGVGKDQLTAAMKGQGGSEYEPIVLGTWQPNGLAEDECQTRWHQMWQVLNVLLHLRGTWVGSADMPGLEALQDAPLLKHVASGVTTEWLAAFELLGPDAQAWAIELAESGAAAPDVGYELMDAKGRVIAEAEMAWADLRVAVLLPSADGQSHFLDAGWYCVCISDAATLTALKSKLNEELV
jgi:DEAD/DEAH box helicase domain-containing protein